MIYSVSYILSLVSDEQKSWVCKATWILVLCALSSWLWCYYKRGLANGDPMMLSGFITVLIGISYSLVVDRDQVKLIKRLHDIAVLDLDKIRWLEIKVLLKKYDRRCLFCVSFVVFILMVVGYSDLFGTSGERKEFIVASFICTALVGLRLGRIVANGLTGHAIKRVSPSFEMVIQHPDGAGGLDNIGRFYLWQAGALLIPTSWLLIWIWIIPDRDGYDSWLPHFWRLLIVLVFLVWPASVIAPMYSFYRLIVTWKANHLEHAVGEIRTRFCNLRKSHLHGESERRQIREIFNYLHSLTILPDWPLSPRTLALFFTAVVLPISAAILGSMLSRILVE